MAGDPKENNNFRKISKDKYIVAGVITLLIFGLGLTLGIILDDQRYNLVEEVNMEQEVRYLSLQMQYLYLNSFSSYNNCPILTTALKATVEDLSNSLGEVISYEEENKASDKRKDLVMRRYFLDNIRYWMLVKESQEKCQMEIVTILYFYSEDCPSCPSQGTILTYFKTLFGEQVLVFPINLRYQESEPMIDIITSQFEVTKYPTLVINDKKYEGVMDQEQLQQIICISLTSAPQCQR